MNTRRFAIVMSLFVLTACSTAGHQPELAATEIGAKLLSSRVNVQPVSNPVMPSERTKSQATANFLLSSLASSVIGSMGQAANPQAFQANAEIAQTFGQQMQQALQAGETVASGQGVDVALAGRLAGYFASMQGNRTENEVSIQVNARRWELGYQSFLGSSDYVLAYNFEVVASEAKPDGVRVLKTVSCLGEADRRMPQDGWRNEDYREVDSATRNIVDSCLKRILMEMALPFLKSA